MSRPAIPPFVQARLGPAPVDLTGAGSCHVMKGHGLVAKAGPPEVIERERYALEDLGPQLPLVVAPLVDAGDGWLLFDDVDDTDVPWAPSDVGAALSDLANLHAAFVAAPALADPRLVHPLGDGLDGALAYARRMAGLDSILPGAAALAADPSPLVDALHEQPSTLLHGDPWPLNVLRPEPGRRVWLDWAGVAAGPAALDVASWLDQSPWVLDGPDHPSVAQQLDGYVDAAAIDDVPAFTRAVDAATLLWFLTIDLPRLPVVRHAPDVVERLLAPRRAALARLTLG
ncbi:MAG TPA: hypothetical protein VI916_03185 [Acidimicrobiia bacterium]|nr:hypothetical protein [Acidimicrobiia bacterium]